MLTPAILTLTLCDNGSLLIVPSVQDIQSVSVSPTICNFCEISENIIVGELPSFRNVQVITVVFVIGLLNSTGSTR